MQVKDKQGQERVQVTQLHVFLIAVVQVAQVKDKEGQELGQVVHLLTHVPQMRGQAGLMLALAPRNLLHVVQQENVVMKIHAHVVHMVAGQMLPPVLPQIIQEVVGK